MFWRAGLRAVVFNSRFSAPQHDIPFNWTELKNDQEAKEKVGAAGLRDDKHGGVSRWRAI